MLVALALAWGAENGFADAVRVAEEALAVGDYTAAGLALAAAREEAPRSPTLIPATELGKLSFYRGAIDWRTGSKDQALDEWRTTLSQVPGFQPLAAALPDPDGQDAFYALVAEVRGFREVATGLPADPGEALVYIDGRRLGPEDFVFAGEHFLQVRCADQSVHGGWWRFGHPPQDYLVVCAGGSWGAAVARNEEPRPRRGGRGPPQEAAAEVERPPTPPGLARRATGWTLLGTGALLLGGGAATNFLLVEPAWRAVDAANDPATYVARADATAMEARFDRARALTLVFFGAGTAFAGTGVALRPYQVELYVAPGGVGVAGRF